MFFTLFNNILLFDSDLKLVKNTNTSLRIGSLFLVRSQAGMYIFLKSANIANWKGKYCGKWDFETEDWVNIEFGYGPGSKRYAIYSGMQFSRLQLRENKNLVIWFRKK